MSAPMRTQPGRGRTVRRRRSTLAAVGVALLLLCGLVAGCANVPRAVLNVPFTYTQNMCDNPGGGGNSLDGGTNCLPGAVVIVCLDQPSAIHLTTTADHFTLVWNGVTYAPGEYVRDLTTPVLQPGCGDLSFGYSNHLYHYATVTAEKV